MLTLYRMKLSTNAERVALALAHKGLVAESIWIPNEDRSRVLQVSGQDRVPVLVVDGEVVIDSMEIVRFLEDRFPDRPPVYPQEPARKAECLLFIDWFNKVWKGPPNDLEGELGKPESERESGKVERLGRRMQDHLDLFEQMLTGRDFLLGSFSAADIAAFPFLRYATHRDPDDPYLFHEILVTYQQPGTNHPRVVDWIARMEQKPRA